jgi:conjugal transfer pilus assembly protein TraF
MLKQFAVRSILFSVALTCASAAISQTATTGNSSYVGGGRDDGWFFYKDKPVTEKPPEKTPEKPIVLVPAPIPSEAAPPAAAKTAPEQFSVAWVRAKLPILQENAINNPTDENVRAYKYVERIMLDLSTNYGKAVSRVVANDPALNEEARFPIASAARASALLRIDKARKEIIKDLASKAGLWMFFDSRCDFCAAQYETVKEVARKNNFTVRYISIDGKGLPGMKTFLNDPGGVKAKQMGVKITPAVALVIPPLDIAIVAHGAMAQPQLEQKIVTAAIEMKATPQALIDIANLQERGILTPKDMTDLRTAMPDTDDPKELVRVINAAVGKAF